MGEGGVTASHGDGGSSNVVMGMLHAARAWIEALAEAPAESALKCLRMWQEVEKLQEYLKKAAIKRAPIME